jgi:hypothetical protein
MSLQKDLQIFYNHRYVHPWEEMEALIDIWLKHKVKSKREITGEYFFLYHKWLSNFLDDDETKANFAIVQEILRRYDSVDNSMKTRKGAISTETYLHILQSTPLEILEKVSTETFRGRNAYILDDNVEDVNVKLPHPGEDVLHEFLHRGNLGK